MDIELEGICEQISLANRPEDLFGTEDVILPPGTLKEFLQAEYEKLRSQIDPDEFQHPEEIEAATEALRRLDELYHEGINRIDRQHFALPGFQKLRPKQASASFTIGANRYYKGVKRADTEWCSVYQGYLEYGGHHVGEVDIKVAHAPEDNQRARNELRILDLVHEKHVPQWKHLPLVLDRFQTGDRMGLILRSLHGYTLSEVHQHPVHINGVDQRDMFWMLDRCLSALGYVHRQGVVHGALTPDTVMIQPASHNVFLTDWSHAVYNPAVRGERGPAISEIFGAPEVKNGGEIGPWSDIYSIGKIMIWLLGGDPLTNQIPEYVEKKVSRFLREFVHESRYARPSDAWELYQEQTHIKDSLWKRKFRHFDMG